MLVPTNIVGNHLKCSNVYVANDKTKQNLGCHQICQVMFPVSRVTHVTV